MCGGLGCSLPEVYLPRGMPILQSAECKGLTQPIALEVNLFSMPDAPGCTLHPASCDTVLLSLPDARPFNI